MSLTGKTNAQKIWNYLTSHGLSAAGAAGVMGNLKAESSLKASNLQDTYQKKLGYTDASYTKAVDSGEYTNFIHDCAGYGLAQWTYHTRKADLLAFAQAKGKSIGDLETQLEFLMKELSENYAGLLSFLKTTGSIKDASDRVLTQYERPADMGDFVKATRAGYGQSYYEQFAAEIPVVEEMPIAPVELKIGDIVTFVGAVHHTNSNALGGTTCQPGKAKVTAIYKKGIHPYHLIRVSGGGSSVYGWVNVEDIEELKQVESEATQPEETVKKTSWSIGDEVDFTGGTHYVNSNAARGDTCKPGKAKITSINPKGKHPYHLIRVPGKGSSVYGWVDATDIGADEIEETEESDETVPAPVDFWSTVKYFRREEFACKCGKYCDGYPVEPSEDLIRALDEIRERAGSPIYVNSGIRCRQHNAETPDASSTSRHMDGDAADIRSNDKTPRELYNIACSVIGNTGGVGLYSWGIHVDKRGYYARW